MTTRIENFEKNIRLALTDYPGLSMRTQLYCILMAEGAHGASIDKADKLTGLNECFFQISYSRM